MKQGYNIKVEKLRSARNRRIFWCNILKYCIVASVKASCVMWTFSILRYKDKGLQQFYLVTTVTWQRISLRISLQGQTTASFMPLNASLLPLASLAPLEPSLELLASLVPLEPSLELLASLAPLASLLAKLRSLR